MNTKAKLDIVAIQAPLMALSFVAIFVLLLPTPGTIDTISWIEWSKNISEHGLIKGYAANRDLYPPLYSVYLYASSLIADACGFSVFYGIKITTFFSLLVSTAIIYYWSSKNSVITFLFFIPLAYTCISLMYLGIHFAPFFFASMYLLHKKKLIPSIICFTISTLIKQSPLIVAPFLLVYAVKYCQTTSNTPTAIIKQLTLALSTASIIYLLTYAVFGKPFLDAFILGFKAPDLVYQALNLNYLLLSIYQNTPIENLEQIAYISFSFFYISTLIAFILKKKNAESLFLFCLTGNFAYFMFSRGVHENHLYLSVLASICLTLVNIRYLPLALNITLIHCINLLIFYGAIGTGLDAQAILNAYKIFESVSYWHRPIELSNTALLVICCFNILSFLAIWISTVFSDNDQPPLTTSR